MGLLGAALRARGFRRLAFSYTINDLGDTFGLVALAVLVFGETDSVLRTTMLFVAGRFVPAFIAPALVARLDRSSPRAVLSSLYAAEAGVFAALAIVASDFALPSVLLLALFDGTLAIAARGISRGAIATTLGEADALREGNAIINALFGASSVIGPVLGGVVTSWKGPSTALAVDAVSFALVAGVLGSAPLPGAVVDSDTGWLVRLRAGLREVTARRDLRRLITAEGVVLAFFTLITPIEVVYATETLDAGTVGYGVLLGSWGVGTLAGAILFARVRRGSLVMLLGGSTAAVGVGYLGMAAAPGIGLACAASVIGGGGNGIQWIAHVTALQERTPGALLARIGGLMESVNAAVPGIGYILGGLLAAAASTRVVFLVAGVGAVLLAPYLGRAASDP